MKTPQNVRTGSCRKNSGAFTLVEMMIVVGIMLILLLGMVFTQMYGLKVATLATNRASMSSYGRQAMDQIRDAVRGAQNVYIGNCSPTNPASFTRATGAQQGAALQVYSTTNIGPPYVIYYLDNSNARTNYIKSYSVDASNVTSIQTLAAYVTNTVVFYAEDYLGNVLTNNVNNRVIDVLFQFNQYAFVNKNNLFTTSYQLRTRTTQRVLNAY